MIGQAHCLLTTVQIDQNLVVSFYGICGVSVLLVDKVCGNVFIYEGHCAWLGDQWGFDVPLFIYLFF